MNRHRVIALILIGLAIVAAVVFVMSGRKTPSGDDLVRVAANLPLSGALATYGVSVREGATLALEDDNAQNPGAKQRIEFDWQDNAGDPKTAVTVLRKQLTASPAIYVSGVKPQTMAIKDEISRIGLPHFVWIFDAAINQGSVNNFRTWVSYKIEPREYQKYAKHVGARRVAITYVQLPHTIDEFNRLLLPSLRADGIRDLYVEPYDFGREDFKDIAAKIAAFKPDLIILNGFQTDLVKLVRALRPLRAMTDGNTIATYDLLDAARILGADELEGIRIVAPVFETRPSSSTIATWRSRFRSRYKREPLYTHAFAYDMVTAMLTALRSSPAPSSNRAWITALKSVDTQGITGPIRFDSDGDMLTPLEVGVYRKGVLTPDEREK